MDKKKLIGTIIGVTMFAALIAGATFAWLTITATVSGGNYITASRNFVIAYESENDISGLPILTITSASSVKSSGANTVVISAALANANSTNGDLSLTLNTTTDGGGFVAAGAIRYAVSINNGTATAPQTVTSTAQNLVLAGSSTKHLIDDTTADTITIYMWLDGETVVNNMVGKSYSGYISASAIQNES